jgi:hypothetical protein
MLAYKSAGTTLPRNQVKAHEVRTIASSWSIFNSASLTEILSAGFWRSDNTFYYHYLRSMPPIWSCVNTMTCGGSHLGFRIGMKKTKFVEDLQMIILGQFGFNCRSDLREEAF